MLSEKWNGYERLLITNTDGDSLDLKQFGLSSIYMGIPYDLPVGRKFPDRHIRFGEKIDIDALLEQLAHKSDICLIVESLKQNNIGHFGVVESRRLCN